MSFIFHFSSFSSKWNKKSFFMNSLNKFSKIKFSKRQVMAFWMLIWNSWKKSLTVALMLCLAHFEGVKRRGPKMSKKALRLCYKKSLILLFNLKKYLNSWRNQSCVHNSYIKFMCYSHGEIQSWTHAHAFFYFNPCTLACAQVWRNLSSRMRLNLHLSLKLLIPISMALKWRLLITLSFFLKLIFFE